MARPIKDYEEKKIKLTYVRLTEFERHMLEDAAKLEDYTLSDYIRSRLFTAYQRTGGKEPITRKTLIELNRIGNNLNQLTKAANSGKVILVDDQQVIFEILAFIKEIHAKLI